MIGLTSQWTILERLEYESAVAELRDLDPKVQAGDAPSWERAKDLLERTKELVKLAHARAARPVVEASGC